MNISSTKIYEDKYINELNDNAIPDKGNQNIGRNDNTGNIIQERISSVSMSGHDKIISKNERDFFINLFPENSEQLQKHTLFNQNGRLQSPNINKGQIVDGRV
jgi:hypothetical protein